MPHQGRCSTEGDSPFLLLPYPLLLSLLLHLLLLPLLLLILLIFPHLLTPLLRGEQDEKVDKIETKNKRVDKKSSGEEKVAILLRDAFGTFKDEVPYYSARLLSIPEASVPGFKELDERYEEWFGGED